MAEFAYLDSGCGRLSSVARIPLHFNQSQKGLTLTFDDVPAGNPKSISTFYELSEDKILTITYASFEVWRADGSRSTTEVPADVPAMSLKKSTTHPISEWIRTNSISLNLGKVTTAVSAIRNFNSFPNLQAGSNIQQIVGPDPLPIEDEGIFENLIGRLFRNPKEFKLISMSYEGNAQCVPHLKQIGIDPHFQSFWNANADQIELTFAHEASHYLYELYIEKLSKGHLSPNLQSTGYASFPGHDDARNNDMPIVVADSFRYANMHAEVDLFAAAVLIDQGHDRADVLSRFKARDQAYLKMFQATADADLDMFSKEELPGLIDIYIRDAALTQNLEAH